MKHVDAGHRLRDQGQLEAALAEFRLALTLDPGTVIADQEATRTAQMIEQVQAGKKAEDVLTPQQQKQRDYENRLMRAEGPAELMPVSRSPINLKMTNESKIVFETIGKLAGSPGINVLTDPDYQSRRITVDLVNSTLEQALDYAGILAKTKWAPISSNTIVIYQDNKA